MRNVLLVVLLGILPSTVHAQEPVSFHDGLLKYQAEAVYEALQDDIIQDFKLYLEMHLKIGEPAIDYKGWFNAADVVLSKNYPPAIFVYTVLPGLCGSGGCGTYFLLKVDGKWTNIGYSYVGCAGLVVLDSYSNGLRDILETDCKVTNDFVMKFDGKKYVENTNK